VALRAPKTAIGLLVLGRLASAGLNGIEGDRRIQQRSPWAHIVFVTQDGDKDVMDAAVSMKGARDVLKSNAATELVPAIAAALADHYAATL
jgi:DNA-binding NarL/FixJ family response regulator